jgi:hypothetical protein
MRLTAGHLEQRRNENGEVMTFPTRQHVVPISKRRWLRNGHSSSRQGTNAILWASRGVDENELIAGAGQDLPLSRETPGAAKVLSDN